MNSLTFKDFIMWGFCGLISLLIFLGIGKMDKFAVSLEKVNDSISILNTQVAVLIVKEPYQNKINEDLQARVKFLEQIVRSKFNEKN